VKQAAQAAARQRAHKIRRSRTGASGGSEAWQIQEIVLGEGFAASSLYISRT
jgi:hypothetical protein